EIISIPHFQPLELKTEPICRGLGVAPLRRDDRIAWVHDHGNACGARHGFLEQLEPLRGQIARHVCQTRHVPAPPGQVRHEPGGDGITDLDYDDRHSFCGGDGCAGSRRVLSDDETYVEFQQLLSQSAESVELSVSESNFDDDVSPFFPPEVAESVTECAP